MTFMSGRLRRRRPRDLLEWDPLVGPGLGRETQHSLSEDVALDLVGAAANRYGRRRQEQREPLVLTRRRDQPAETLDVDGQPGQRLDGRRAPQLGARPFGTGPAPSPTGL